MSSIDTLYHYTCWGIDIASELECPELLNGSGGAEVFVRFGETPEKLSSVKLRGVRFEMNEEDFLLKMDGVANYWVKNSREIIIEPIALGDERSIRLFLLGSVFGALLHRRGLSPFHGSAVAMNGRAVLFAGSSAAGKSTLAAEMCRRGHSLIADDVCVCRQDETGLPVVLPAYPQAKLWADALGTMDMDTQGLRRVRAEIEKYALPLGSLFCPTPMPLAAVYILNPFNGDGITLQPLHGRDKFIALSNNTYRRRFVEGLGDKSPHYRTCAGIGKHARVVRVDRPRKPYMLKELADLIQEDCRS